MLYLDRKSDVSITRQIADFFRYEIGLGRKYKPGDRLPSTRSLAGEIGASYHTVRQAYALLVEDGIVEVAQGRGYEVTGGLDAESEGRLEAGAELAAEMIKKMVAAGLDESEIEYVVDEQLNLLVMQDRQDFKTLVVGDYEEYASAIAETLSAKYMISVEHCTASRLVEHADADYLIVPVRLLRSLGYSVRAAELITVDSHLPVDALEAVSKLLDYETIGLMTRYPDAIGPLTKAIKDQTGFPGQIIASTTESKRGKILETFVSQIDILLFTSGIRRTVSRLADSRDTPLFAISETLTAESLEKIREMLPD